MSRPTLSIVLTYYNESEIIAGTLDRLTYYLRQQFDSFELVIVDDGSRPAESAALDRIAAHHPDIIRHRLDRNMGRGFAVTAGFGFCRGTYCGFLDTDLEISEQHIAPAIRELKHGADLVIGTRRYKTDLRYGLRTFLSTGYHLLVKLLFRLPFRDTEAGFKFFRKDAMADILDKTISRRWFWDTELVLRAYTAGKIIREMEVTFTYLAGKQSSVKPWRAICDYLKELAVFLWRRR